MIVRGNPGVQNLNPYPTLHKPLPLVKGKGFEGSGSGFWRVEGYKGFVKGCQGFVLNALSNYKYNLLTSLLTICKVIQRLNPLNISFYIVFMRIILLFLLYYTNKSNNKEVTLNLYHLKTQK